MTIGNLRVALVHDYLTQFGGAEQVLAVLQRLFPHAPTFTTLHDRDVHLPGIARDRIVESRLGLAPWFRKHHRAALPLFPVAMRDLGRRLAEVDVVIADSSAWAHLVRPRPGQVLIVYCHSPARFLYGDADYLGPTGLRGAPAQALNAAMSPMRWLDRRAYRRADVVLANSRLVAERLAGRLGIDASVLHPPTDVAHFAPGRPVAPEPWYLVVSRLVPHKRVDLAIQTATRHELPLKIIGSGRDMERLRAMAGPSVEFLGFQPEEVVLDHYRRCRALVLPGVEDFGMTAVEAQASGRPVIAFNRGGARESVLDGVTGVLFDEQSPEALRAAMERLEGAAISSDVCIDHARKFDEPVFCDGITATVEAALTRARSAAGQPETPDHQHRFNDDPA